MAAPIDEHDLHTFAEGSSADYVLRTAQQEAVAISAMADQKANILLGVSAIMLTAVVSVLPTTGVTVALVTLGATVVVAALMALISLLPSTGEKENHHNPLYFADVARMPYDEFRERMNGMLAATPAIYGAIIADLHQTSKVLLDHKYRFIRLGYGVFIVGLCCTVVAVGIDVAVGNI